MSLGNFCRFFPKKEKKNLRKEQKFSQRIKIFLFFVSNTRFSYHLSNYFPINFPTSPKVLSKKKKNLQSDQRKSQVNPSRDVPSKRWQLKTSFGLENRDRLGVASVSRGRSNASETSRKEGRKEVAAVVAGQFLNANNAGVERELADEKGEAVCK